MTNVVRVALAQINVTVGALPANVKKITNKISEARKSGCHVVAFPELSLCGYPPEDLLLKPAFIQACRRYLDEIIHSSANIITIVGFPEKESDCLYNSAMIICNQKPVGTYRKHDLPNYGVFDEQRYFCSSKQNVVFSGESFKMGISICEDIWKEKGVCQTQASSGNASLLINISASPYHRSKLELREHVLGLRAQETKAFVAYCNLVGGQDELVFDGGSVVLDRAGKVMARAAQFEEDLVIVDLDLGSQEDSHHLVQKSFQKEKGEAPVQEIPLPYAPQTSAGALKPHIVQPFPELDEIYHALVLGTRDYILKNGFSKAVLGLSGGIDSSLVACIAVDALGASNVVGVSMPSQYSSDHSKTDAASLADNLKIQYLSISIKTIYDSYAKALEPVFASLKPDITEENLQSRIRGTLLMALSNKFGWLVLTTGNKSEVSVGYSTLYGDMAGGFAVIKDVPKVLVYELCKHRNEKNAVIPENVFTKPPSAELRPDQKDSDSLPEYPILDSILLKYIEQNQSLAQIVSSGFPSEVVKKVIRLVDRAEYKRRQGPPGIKITERALGKDWRLPLTNHFVENNLEVE